MDVVRQILFAVQYGNGTDYVVGEDMIDAISVWRNSGHVAADEWPDQVTECGGMDAVLRKGGVEI